MAQNSIASELNDLLITHDFDVDALSTKTGKPSVNERGVPDSSEADMFKFDWVGPTGKNYGTAVILLDQNGGLTMYFGDNLGRTMDPEDKKAWYGDSETNSPGFLEQLKHFAIRTSKIRGGFGLEDLSKLKYAIAGQAALTESFYGTKKVSYSGQPTEARLMIKHSRPITEGDKRYRYVESLFIETVEGECFRLPFRKLAGGRAMLEHVRQGGKPYDLRGQHIAETVNQINVLSQFRRAHQGRVFEGAAGDLVTETDQYYQRLNHNLKHMATGRGYNRYFESWKPADISEGDIMVEDLRGMFVETRIDPRIESALPMLAKIQQEAKAMKEADIFESWAARLVEGTWAMPDTPEKMTQLKTWLGEPKPLGPDAEDVTDVLYDLIGDDALFDQLSGMAEEDPTADAVPIVQAWITRNKDQSPELSELAMSFQTAAPAAPEAPAAPPAPAAPTPEAPPAAPAQPPVAEGDNLQTFESLQHMRRLAGMPVNENVLTDHTRHTLKHILHTFRRDIHDFLRHGDLSDHLYDALFDYYHEDMPYGVAKARTGDPYEWISDRLHRDLGDHGMLDENWTLPPADATPEEAEAIMKNNQAQQDIVNKSAIFPTPAEPYTGPTSGGVPSNLPAGVNRLQVNKPTAPAVAPEPAPAAEPAAAPTTLQKHYQDNPLVRGLSPKRMEEEGNITVRKVRSPKIVQTQGIPRSDISSWKFNDDPLPHTELNPYSMPQGPDISLPMTDLKSSPMPQGPDLTSGEPFADEVGYDGKWIPRIHISGVGKTHDDDETLDECNYTALNEYCPKHGLRECWLEEMTESILETGAKLISEADWSTVKPPKQSNVPAANPMAQDPAQRAQSALDATQNGPAAASPMSQDPAQRAQAAVRPVTPAKAAGSTTPTQEKGSTMPLAPTTPADSGDQLDRLKQLAGQATPDLAKQNLFKRLNNIPQSDQPTQNLYKGLNNIPQSGQTQPMDALYKGLNGTPAPAAAPAFRTPGEAHAGQGGYDYNDDPDQSDAETARLARSGIPGEPKGQAHAGQGGYDYNDDAETKGQAHAGQGGYDYNDDPDQSDAETARLGRAGNSPSFRTPGEAHADQDGYDYNDDEDQSDAETARLGRAGTPNTPNDRKMNDANWLGELARIKSLAMIRN